MPVTLEKGAVVAGRYKLVRLLGAGGMGVVWAATHTVTLRGVALKFLKPSGVIDPLVLQRFLREARAACAVRHPNVVVVHDVLELEDGAPMMVMDLLEGESLGERLAREGALSISEVARLLLPVASAVGTAHAVGIVHRDLKPDNIFLSREGDHETLVKVLDFGIAKLTASEGAAAQSSGLTGTGALLGTPFYMSPEQIFGERDIDHRSDVWALGVILYESLAGRRPTEAANVGQVLKLITQERIPPLADVNPAVPADVSELVARMLSRDRATRPASLHEVVVVLSRYADVATPRFAEPLAPAAPSVTPAVETPAADSTPLTKTDALLEPAAPAVDRAAETREWTAPHTSDHVISPSSHTLGTNPVLVASTSRRSRRIVLWSGAGALCVATAVGLALLRAQRDHAQTATDVSALPEASAVVPSDAAPNAAASSVPPIEGRPPAHPIDASAPKIDGGRGLAATPREPTQKSLATTAGPSQKDAAAPPGPRPPDISQGGVVEKPPF